MISTRSKCFTSRLATILKFYNPLLQIFVGAALVLVSQNAQASSKVVEQELLRVPTTLRVRLLPYFIDGLCFLLQAVVVFRMTSTLLYSMLITPKLVEYNKQICLFSQQDLINDMVRFRYNIQDVNFFIDDENDQIYAGRASAYVIRQLNDLTIAQREEREDFALALIEKLPKASEMR